MRTVAVTLAAALLSATVLAQQPGPGLTWYGSSNNSTGSFYPGCHVLPVTMVPGETVIVTVWGDVHSPFGLFLATDARQCLQIRGLGGGLALDFPVFTIALGVLSQTTPCLSCPPGLEPFTFVLPGNLPPGTALALQGVAMGGGQPAFTGVIRAQV
jgi:hypothetical protein